MEIRAMIIHKLAKEIANPAVLTVRESLLAVDSKATAFVKEVRDSYYKSGIHHGTFDANSVSFPFQALADNYLSKRTDFIKFSMDAMKHLKTLIDAATLATGSYVVFSHFIPDDEFLSVVLLNDKQGYAIDDKLNLKAAIHLETNKIHVASSVNVTRWKKQEDPHLTFIRGSRDVAQYFQNFIGCTDLTPAKEASKRFKAAVADYLNKSSIDVDEREHRLSMVYDRCADCIRRKQPINLSMIAGILNPSQPEEFVQFANGEQYKVSSVFNGHSQTLRSLKFISFRSKELSLTFDHSLFGTRIVYKQRENSLIIKDVPEELREQLPLPPEL
jgi:nucleoid-associated protein